LALIFSEAGMPAGATASRVLADTPVSWRAYSYDADVNLLKGPAPTGAALGNFSYDARNRLSEGAGVSYQYNP
jgi:hypothetical protein